MTDTDTNGSGRDRQLRFLLDRAGVRGVHVRLDQTWQQIRQRESYPGAAACLLGQACAAAALFTGHTKVDGRLSVQLRSDGAIRTLFAECTAAGTLRGIVQLADGVPAMATPDLRELGPGGILAITIENHGAAGGEQMRYQGMVPLEAQRLDTAFEDYFRQSEQLPTRILLASDDNAAAGLMVQTLPGEPADADGWNRIGALFETLGAQELLDTPGADLLHRLFHDDDLKSLAERPLSFACSCSRERVESMLAALGAEEAQAAAETGQAEIRCEFCGQSYVFSPVEIDALFSAPVSSLDAPTQLQ